MLDEVKRYLSITWSDSDTDLNIQDLINEGTSYLDDLVGVTLNFAIDFEAKSLLKDYCRYARNYSKEEFQQNFQRDLLKLQFKYATKKQESPNA